MKIVIYILIALTIGLNADAYQVVTNHNGLNDNFNMYQLNNDYPKISLLEQSLYNRTYETDNIYKRLNRLEQKIFRKTFPNMSLANRVEKLSNAFAKKNLNTNISKFDLTQLEKQYFGQSFKNDSVEDRISRLEQNIFGTIQTGNLQLRFNNLVQAYQNTKMQEKQKLFTQNPYGTGYSSMNNNQNFGGLLKNAFNSFFTTGQLTGFTPPIYNPYPYRSSVPNFYNPYDMGGRGYNSGFSGRGYRYYNNGNIGNTSSVRVFY